MKEVKKALTKFKVGDRIRLKSNIPEPVFLYHKQIYTITDISSYPYTIQNIQIGNGLGYMWYPAEFFQNLGRKREG